MHFCTFYKIKSAHNAVRKMNKTNFYGRLLEVKLDSTNCSNLSSVLLLISSNENSKINIDELKSIFLNFGEIFEIAEYFQRNNNTWYLINNDLKDAYECVKRGFLSR